MELLKNKKIAFLMILFSVLLLIFGVITKDYTGTYQDLKFQGYNTPPLKLHNVSIFGVSIDYVNYLLFLTLTLGIGIYLLIYKDDQYLRDTVNKYRFYNSLKAKYYKIKSKKTPIKVLNITESTKDQRILEAVRLLTFIALFITFFIAIEIGFSLWFFIIFAYLHFITLTPKSKKEILIKSIGYPMVFLVIFSVSQKNEMLYGIEIERAFSYKLSKHFLPYILGAIVMYFTQRSRFGIPPRFNIKNPLFWTSLICLILSVIKLYFIIV